RIVVVDADHDQRITPEEISKAVPAATAWLKKKVLISVNDTETDLGDFQRYESVWPNSNTQAVTDQEASQRYVDFHFTRPWPGGVREVWTGFQIFAQVGDQHVIQAVYQQQGQPDLAVEFSQQEPEYLYDTGWPPGAVAAPAASAPHSPGSLVMGWAGLLLGGLAAAMWWFRRRGQAGGLMARLSSQDQGKME
ncbi:MAG: hypothetical protein JWO94_3449, partial [Verrucomicrobiaceae bacterium]|nr:hypothetical protein [Verrucomicrobiaceae bacterium]